MKTLNLVACGKRSLEKKGVDDIVSGTNNTLGFTVLRRSVWAGHPQERAMGEEEGA